MTLTINKKKYKVKYTIRALFIFEQITGKQFSINTLLDNYLFFYSMILANNEDVLSWDEFLDALDNDPKLFTKIAEMLNKESEKDKLLNDDDDKSDGQKKS